MKIDHYLSYLSRSILASVIALGGVSCGDTDERVAWKELCGNWTVDWWRVRCEELENEELRSMTLQLREDQTFSVSRMPAGVMGNGSGAVMDYTGRWSAYDQSGGGLNVTYLVLTPSEKIDLGVSEFVTRVDSRSKSFRIDCQDVEGAIGGIIPMKKELTINENKGRG